MQDAFLTTTKTLPNAAANNSTSAFDINPDGSGSMMNQWRLGYVSVSVPALSDHTNTSVTNTFTLQESSDNSNWANTNPLVSCGVVGVASTGSAATTFRVPLTPMAKRYVRFIQVVPTNGGTGSNATVTYAVNA